MNKEMQLLKQVKEKYLLQLKDLYEIDDTSNVELDDITSIVFIISLQDNFFILTVEEHTECDIAQLDEVRGSSLIDCLEKLLKQ